MAEGSPKHPLAKGSIPWPNLPEEIITEILLRLPVKALLKFRCVSKSWLSLISSPQFIKTHLNISTKNNIYSHNRLIFKSGSGPNVFHTISLHAKFDEYLSVETVLFNYPLSVDSYWAIRIVGSCNGLVCVVLEILDLCTVVLWNPSTRKLKQLPSCDGLWEEAYHGFGYDEVNDDYKVFQTYCIRSYPNAYETQVEVYSSRTDSWRIVNWPGGKIFDGPGVFVNGAIHWKVHYDGNSRNSDIIAQNVTTETCLKLELPMLVNDDDDDDDDDDAYVMLGVCGGCLCASYDHGSHMDVWVMKEYGVKESWSKIFCFSYFSLDVLWLPELLFVSPNGAGLLKIGGDLVMYKPSGCHEILRLGNSVRVAAATCSESLISPDFDHLAWRK